MTVLKNCTLELQYKVFIWGVWANFLNKINEKIEFELRNSDNKLKIQLTNLQVIKLAVIKIFMNDILSNIFLLTTVYHSPVTHCLVMK